MESVSICYVCLVTHRNVLHQSLRWHTIGLHSAGASQLSQCLQQPRCTWKLQNLGLHCLQHRVSNVLSLSIWDWLQRMLLLVTSVTGLLLVGSLAQTDC
jgi:hypothetical protein